MTEVEIANLALMAIGQAKIESMTQEGSQAADLCNTLYPQIRDSLLEETQWTFARAEIALAEVDNVWNRWQYAYAYPNDCLKINYLLPINQASVGGFTDFANDNSIRDNELQFPREVTCLVDSTTNIETGQKVILTNVSEAYLVYTKAVKNPNLFPNAFIDAVAAELALKLSNTLIIDRGIRQELRQELQMEKAVAKRAAANESVEYKNQVSSFEAYRN